MYTGKIKTLYSDEARTEALFPRTKTSAVSDENGVNLDVLMEHLAYVNEYEQGEEAEATVNADTLGGLSADFFATKSAINNITPESIGAAPIGDYATKDFVRNAVADAQIAGGESDIDLSGFATKDDLTTLATKTDLNNIDFPVDSVNGKTGAVTLSASDVGAAPAGYGPGDNSSRVVTGDLNSVTVCGWYYYNTANITTTLPSGITHGWLEVMNRNGAHVIQRITDVNGRVIQRIRDAANWGNWVDCSAASFVPTSRTINSKALSSNITLSASDVGALGTSGAQTLAGSLAINDANNAGYNIGMTRKINSTDYKVYMQPTADSGNWYYYQGSTLANGMLLNADSTNFRRPVNIASGGTGAITADLALANLGGTKFELLWENASPASAFAAQSISIPKLTTNYKMILVDCLEHRSSGAWRWYHASAIAQTNCDAGYGSGTPTRVMSFGEEGTDISFRPFCVYSDSIYFSEGYYATTFSASPSTSSNILIPLRIYGIK